MSPSKLPLQLSDASGVPYYRQIVDQVSNLIRSGQLQPNIQLPSVRELAGHLLVSLITVRRSYADLENAGLIVRRQGYGTFVSEDIQMASREQALNEAKSLLTQTVAHLRQLGLDGRAIREVFEQTLSGQGGDDDRH